MTKVSVLVAVYNAERYLSKCIDSLINQTLKDIQIICIDDYSTDNSLEILRNYEHIDKRVKVISLTKNSGQAHARNVGLSYVDGNFVTFLDSDDWMSEDALQSAIDVFNSNKNIDCVLFDMVYHYDDANEKSYPMTPFKSMSGYDAFVKSLTWSIHGCYIVKVSIHKFYPYDETCRTYSDDNTTRIHYLVSKEVSCCDGKYYYRQLPTSVTHSIDLRRLNHMKANESMKRQLINLNVSEDILNIYEEVRWLVVVDTYMFYFKYRSKFSASERLKFLNEMKRIWKGIETFRLSRKYKLKFGYIPLQHSWQLFRAEEESYFFLKRLLRKL
jgi:glycosyltransferase involved in cell wall biosynthesis